MSLSFEIASNFSQKKLSMGASHVYSLSPANVYKYSTGVARGI